MIRRISVVCLVMLAMFVVVSTSAFAKSCDKDLKLEAAFAKLDQAYIPPLFYTSAGNVPAALKSMRILTSSFEEFANENYNHRRDYAHWQSYIDQIRLSISEANAIVSSGVQIIDAHEALEHVRVLMIDFRGTNGFPNVMPDKLTLFHEPMEHIALLAKGKTPSQITPEVLADMRSAIPELEKTWIVAVQSSVDPALWELSLLQTATLYQALHDESVAVAEFESVLDSNDIPKILAAAMGLKKKFVPVYTTFGDFARVAQ